LQTLGNGRLNPPEKPFGKACTANGREHHFMAITN
jgi:hypothetical protein